MLAKNYAAKEKAFLQTLRIGIFLTFLAINLKFIIGDIIKPLILFNVLQFGGDMAIILNSIHPACRIYAVMF